MLLLQWFDMDVLYCCGTVTKRTYYGGTVENSCLIGLYWIVLVGSGSREFCQEMSGAKTKLRGQLKRVDLLKEPLLAKPSVYHVILCISSALCAQHV